MKPSISTKKTKPRTYGGLSEAERLAERRERFLAAGLEVFGTLGLRGATVRGLCKAAGLTERYFYESFEDTEALFCAVYDKQVAALRDYFVAEIPRLPRDLNARVRAALGLYFNMMRDSRMVRIMHVDVMGASPRISAMHEANARLSVQVAAFLLRSDNPELELSNELALGLGIAINGACTTMAVQWMTGGYTLSQDIVVESCSLLVFGTMSELAKLRDVQRAGQTHASAAAENGGLPGESP